MALGHDAGRDPSPFHNGIEEGGPRNGVRTAVEDFVREGQPSLNWHLVPGYFGLGMLYTDE